MSGILYLLPCPISDSPAETVLPDVVLGIARRLRYFLAENAKSTRAYLKSIGHPTPLRELDIVEIGHEPAREMIDSWLAPLLGGRDGALVSEAGCPAVADPGASIVAAAHARAVPVRPLVGPSSLLLALMASGLNGALNHMRDLKEILDAEKKGVKMAAKLAMVIKKVLGGTPRQAVNLFAASTDSKSVTLQGEELPDGLIKYLLPGEEAQAFEVDGRIRTSSRC